MERTLQNRDIGQKLRKAGIRRKCALGQKNERVVGPRGLSLDPISQPLPVCLKQGFLSENRALRCFEIGYKAIKIRDRHGRDPHLSQDRRGDLSVPPNRSEDQDVLATTVHCPLGRSEERLLHPRKWERPSARP